MSDLFRADGQLVNGSASQRLIAAQQAAIENLREQNDHLRAHIAVIVYNAGGDVAVRLDDLKKSYEITALVSDDNSALTWSSTLKEVSCSPSPSVLPV